MSFITGKADPKLRKTPKSSFIFNRPPIRCPYGCLGTFRTDWDRQQHLIYAHDADSSPTMIASISEAFKNVGSPLQSPRSPADDGASAIGSLKSWKLGSQVEIKVQVVVERDQQKSPPPALSRNPSIVRKFGDLFNGAKKPSSPPPRALSRATSIRAMKISDPIPHASALQMAERIGTDLETARRHRRHHSLSNEIPVPPLASPTPIGPIQHPFGFGPPIILEDKDFDSSSESDYSRPSSASPVLNTPPFVRRASILSTNSASSGRAGSFGSKARPNLLLDMTVNRTIKEQEFDSPPSPYIASSRPTSYSGMPSPSATSPPRSPISRPSRPSAMAMTNRTSEFFPRHAPIPVRDTASPVPPPVPSRNPAREQNKRRAVYSDSGHGPMTLALPGPGISRSHSHSSSPSVISPGAWLRRTPSHGALRI